MDHSRGQCFPWILRVREIVTLVVATVMLAVGIITSGMASLPNANELGFKNQTQYVANKTQITPAGWTFAIWGVIYPWQAIWMVYALSFLFRPSTPRTVSWISLWLYTGTNAFGIIWIYVWGNAYPHIAFPFLFLMWAFILAAISVETVHLYKVTPDMKTSMKYKIDLWITRLLVVNGMCIYAAWLTVATLLNFSVVLQYYAGVDETTTGGGLLWLLSVEVLVYFAFENTIFDRFTRFIFIVYPALIWALSGVLATHWGQEVPNINPVLTLLILVLAILLLIARVVLVTMFAFCRPVEYPEGKREERRLTGDHPIVWADNRNYGAANRQD